MILLVILSKTTSTDFVRSIPGNLGSSARLVTATATVPVDFLVSVTKVFRIALKPVAIAPVAMNARMLEEPTTAFEKAYLHPVNPVPVFARMERFVWVTQRPVTELVFTSAIPAHPIRAVPTITAALVSTKSQAVVRRATA